MKCRRTTTYGGDGGSPFQDNLTQAARMAGIVIRHGEYVEGLMGIYQDAHGNALPGQWFGGTGGRQDAVAFAEDEHLISVKGRSGSLVDQLTFVTNKRTYGPFGGGGGTEWQVSTGSKLVGFFGRCGSLIDRIGFFELIDNQSYLPSAAHGGSGGQPFANDLTEVDRLVGVAVRSGQYIEAIQAIFRTVDGHEVRTPWFGGPGGSPGEFRLKDGERIVMVRGRSGQYVDALTFMTNLGRQFSCGGTGGAEFQVSGEVCGFLGRAGGYVDQLAFFLPAAAAAAMKPITEEEAFSLAEAAQKEAAMAAVAASTQPPEAEQK